MALYTSDRERHLWLWTLVVLTAIYSTLWVTPSLTGSLRERNLVRISVAVCVFAVVVAIAVQTMRRRPDRREIGVLLDIAAVYLWAFFRMQIPEERTHLIEYGLVAVLIHQALVERRSHGRRVPTSAALTVAVTALLGLLDEGIQAILPGRVYDLRDVGFNALAGLLAIGARLDRVQRRKPAL